VLERRGRRRKQLLDYPKEVREEVLDRNLWRTRFGRDYGPVVGQTTDDEYVFLHILNVLVLVL
jgi:hypothetical protein